MNLADVTGIELEHLEDSITRERSLKNATELANAEIVHAIEGAAITELLYWIHDRYSKEGGDKISELDVSNKLEELRRCSDRYKGKSFESIIAYGENAAVVHYKPTKGNFSNFSTPNRVLLIDVGGHYLGATTDMTRTIWLGDKSNKNVVEAYTSVLKGHIALATAKFPLETTGAQLDVLARQFLWQKQQDYGHGTGHGVGNYLAVHEGNMGISRRNLVPLEAGMILSNEPGFYKEGKYGIRLENLMKVRQFGGEFLCFETLTLVPFDERLINFSRLSIEEKAWLKNYHEKVVEKLKPLLSNAAFAWLCAVGRHMQD
jgi:Xaa-Pro aminopeptidase